MKELLKTNIDYIIEQGTKNGWNYRKWNSGTMECWTVQSVEVEEEGTWGSLFSYHFTRAKEYPYSFTELPLLYISLASGLNGNAWIAPMNEYGSNSTIIPGKFQLVRPTTAKYTNSFQVSYYAIGRYK